MSIFPRYYSGRATCKFVSPFMCLIHVDQLQPPICFSVFVATIFGASSFAPHVSYSYSTECYFWPPLRCVSSSFIVPVHHRWFTHAFHAVFGLKEDASWPTNIRSFGVLWIHFIFTVAKFILTLLWPFFQQLQLDIHPLILPLLFSHWRTSFWVSSPSPHISYHLYCYLSLQVLSGVVTLCH